MRSEESESLEKYYLDRAREEFNLGQYEDALGWYDHAWAERRTAMTGFRGGEVCFILKQYRKAIKMLKQALALLQEERLSDVASVATDSAS